MKLVESTLAAALLNLCAITFAIAGGSGGYLSPINTNFTLRGVLTVRGADGDAQTCRVDLTAVTSDGGDNRHAGSITAGKARSRCRAFSLQSLPWNISITSSKGGIAKIDYNWCFEPETVDFTVSKKGVWSFTTAGACYFNGDLKTSPAIVIPK
jgi:hypothetical protein